MRNNISMKVLLFMVSFVLLFTSMGESVLAAKFVGRKKPLRKASEEIERHTGTKGILLKKGIGNTYVLDDKVISLPNNSSDYIHINTFNEPNKSLKMSFPKNVKMDAKAKKTQNGTITYENENSAVDFAIQPLKDGFRSLINIKNSTAPKSYEFDLVLPEGSKLINAKDYTGSESDKEVLVVDKNNNITTIFLPAWAKDANGEEVNTYYTIDGNKLIQVVEFDENSVFPIIADPLPLILAGAGGAALIALGQAAGYTLAAIATIVLAIGVAEAMDKFIAEASANSKPTGNKVKDVKKRLKKEGFKKTGQTGSHEKWKKDDKTVTVPNHGDNYEIPIGTLRNIWKQAGWI